MTTNLHDNPVAKAVLAPEKGRTLVTDSPIPEKGASVRITATEVGYLLNAATFSSSDKARPILTSVLLEVRDGVLHIVATDTHSLYHATPSQWLVREGSEDVACLIQAAEVKAIAKALKDAGAGVLDLAPTAWSFTSIRGTVTGPTTVGDYPNYRALIEPKDGPERVGAIGLGTVTLEKVGRLVHLDGRKETKASRYDAGRRVTTVWRFHGDLKPAHLEVLGQDATVLVCPVRIG